MTIEIFKKAEDLLRKIKLQKDQLNYILMRLDEIKDKDKTETITLYSDAYGHGPIPVSYEELYVLLNNNVDIRQKRILELNEQFANVDKGE